MRAFRIIAAAVIGVGLLAEPALAQMRPVGPPLIFVPPPGARANPGRLPPSGAVNRAIRAYPGSKALGVVPNGGGYNVRVRQGNRVILVPVPGN